MHEQYALSETTLLALETFLDGDANPNGPDFAGMHGFLTGLTVGPRGTLDEEAMTACFDDEAPLPNAEASADLFADLQAWQKSIRAALYHGVRLVLPCPLHAEPNDDTPLNSWCAGFMEALFLDEDDWYRIDEDEIADMTLPMLVLSDLIEDPDLMPLRRDRKMLAGMTSEIPELITSIYLHFHAPEGH